MKRIKKMILRIALMVICSSMLAFKTYAAAPIEPTRPLWSNVSICECMIDVSNNQYYLNVVGNPGTTQIKVNLNLQEKVPGGSFKTVDIWSQTFSARTVKQFRSYPMSSSNEYKVTGYIYVTTNGSTETITLS